MNFNTYHIDELIDIRAQARIGKLWGFSDEIRDYLDTKHVFIFDTKDGQEVYHELGGTRKDLVEKLNNESSANKRFDAWLYSMQSSMK